MTQMRAINMDSSNLVKLKTELGKRITTLFCKVLLFRNQGMPIDAFTKTQGWTPIHPSQIHILWLELAIVESEIIFLVINVCLPASLHTYPLVKPKIA